MPTSAIAEHETEFQKGASPFEAGTTCEASTTLKVTLFANSGGRATVKCLPRRICSLRARRQELPFSYRRKLINVTEEFLPAFSGDDLRPH